MKLYRLLGGFLVLVGFLVIGESHVSANSNSSLDNIKTPQLFAQANSTPRAIKKTKKVNSNASTLKKTQTEAKPAEVGDSVLYKKRCGGDDNKPCPSGAGGGGTGGVGGVGGCIDGMMKVNTPNGTFQVPCGTGASTSPLNTDPFCFGNVGGWLLPGGASTPYGVQPSSGPGVTLKIPCSNMPTAPETPAQAARRRAEACRQDPANCVTSVPITNRPAKTTGGGGGPMIIDSIAH